MRRSPRGIKVFPPGAGEAGQRKASRRILAPMAFVRVNLAVGVGPSPTVELSAIGEGADFVLPNTALLSWLEQQTGKVVDALFSDEDGADPWREIQEILSFLSHTLHLEAPRPFSSETELLAAPPL